jgi:hypothetical protein
MSNVPEIHESQEIRVKLNAVLNAFLNKIECIDNIEE